jgi:hypothetical protein
MNMAAIGVSQTIARHEAPGVDEFGERARALARDQRELEREDQRVGEQQTGDDEGRAAPGNVVADGEHARSMCRPPGPGNPPVS